MMYVAGSLDHLCGIDRIMRVIAVLPALLLAAWLLRDVLLLVFASVPPTCALRRASDWFSQMAAIGPWLFLLIVAALVTTVTSCLAWWRGPVWPTLPSSSGRRCSSPGSSSATPVGGRRRTA